MPTVVTCESCDTRLRVPDDKLGKRIKCPKCAALFVAAITDIAEAPADDPPPRRRPKPPPDDDDDDRREEANDDDDEAARQREEEEEEERRRRRKRRKRRRQAEREKYPSAAAGWLYWLGAAGLLYGLVAFFVVLGVLQVIPPTGFGVALWVMFDVPISAAILIASMFISSFLGGGIEFGDARIVIPKAVILLTFISLIYLLPFGFFLVAPIWWGALMYLFKLDFSECWLLWIVNCGLNWVAFFFVMSLLFAMAGAGGGGQGP